MHLFAYGTLMCPEIIIRVIGFLPPSRSARLPEYRRGPLSGVDYPAIIPQAEALVEGILFLDLPTSAWPLLDRFEDEIYQRCTVSVALEESVVTAAETYVLKPEFRDRLGDSDWNYGEFLRSGKARFEMDYHNFPQSDPR